jgi:hypothetical protein
VKAGILAHGGKMSAEELEGYDFDEEDPAGLAFEMMDAINDQAVYDYYDGEESLEILD